MAKKKVSEVGEYDDDDLVGDPKEVAHTSDGKPRPNIAGDDDGDLSAYRVTSDELRQFIERIERLQAERKDIADQEKEVFAEAKGRGYDVKVMRKVIALRKREPDDVAEEDAVLDMYKAALGM